MMPALVLAEQKPEPTVLQVAYKKKKRDLGTLLNKRVIQFLATFSGDDFLRCQPKQGLISLTIKTYLKK